MAVNENEQAPKDLTKITTIHGLDSAQNVTFYKVGSGIQGLAKSVFDYGQQTGDDSVIKGKNVFELSNKHKAPFYLLSSVANVCKADGILGEKEELFIREFAKSRQINDNDISEILKGKDYTKELIESRQAVCKILYPNDSENEKTIRLNGFKQYFILVTLLAATQDGLVKDEYKVAHQLADKLGLKYENVKECVNIIKLEKQIATLLAPMLNPLGNVSDGVNLTNKNNDTDDTKQD